MNILFFCGSVFKPQINLDNGLFDNNFESEEMKLREVRLISLHPFGWPNVEILSRNLFLTRSPASWMRKGRRVLTTEGKVSLGGFKLKYSSLARVRGTHRDRSVLKLVSDPKVEQVWSDLLVAIFITVDRDIDRSVGQQV